MDRLLPVYDYIVVGDHQVGVYTALLFLGFTATFTILLLLRTDQPKEWLKYPALGFLAASVLAFFMGESFEAFLPGITFLVVGIVMLSALFIKERVTHQHSS